MTTVSEVAPAGPGRSGRMPTDDRGDGTLVRLGLRFTNWAERWFPDAYVFVALGVAVVAAAALVNGASPAAVATSFGDGFWSLITFTMQMVMVVVSGYVVASSPPAARLIDALAGLPRSGRGAVPFLAAVSMLTSLLNWGMSLVFQRPAGARAGPAHRPPHRLSRGRRRRLSRNSGRPGHWDSARRPHSCRRTRRACRSRCCRSPASSRFPRRSFCGNPWWSRWC